ncbi:MAG: hypothetical protein RPS47_15305 [Colwellia sp.]|jgi:hypothetical protein
MILTGLPDLERFQLPGEQFLYGNYNEAKKFSLLPFGLKIGKLADNALDFHLTLLRSSDSAPYGRLDFRVLPEFDTEKGLQDARKNTAGAVLNTVRFESGFLRFKNNSHILPPEVITPVVLSWDGLGKASYCIYLSSASAVLLKQCLNDDTINFIAYADMEFRGVSPRLPLTIEFNPATLVTDLCALATEKHTADRIVAYDAIVQYFKTDISQLPLTLFSGNISNTKSPYFAATMTDRVRMAFAEFISVPGGKDESFLQLVSPAQAGSGRFSWVLSEAVSTLRPVCLAMNPFEAAQQLVHGQGEGAVVSEVTVPAIETGYQTITIASSLPSPLSCNVILGVNLSVAPDYPNRPREQKKTIEFKPPQNLYDHTFFFTTDSDAINFDYQPYAVIFDSKGAHPVQGKKQSFDGSLLYINPQSFPITFVQIEAEQALMDIAVFKGTVLRANKDKASFELTTAKPSVSLEYLQLDGQDIIEGQAVSLDGKHSVQLPSTTLDSMTIGRYSFAEYGYQKVKVTCLFEHSQQALLIEFQGEGVDTPCSLFFFPDSNQQNFGWSTVSIFQCKYRYKLPDQSWSDYLSPDKPLHITV